MAASIVSPIANQHLEGAIRPPRVLLASHDGRRMLFPVCTMLRLRQVPLPEVTETKLWRLRPLLVFQQMLRAYDESASILLHCNLVPATSALESPSHQYTIQ